MDVFGLYYSLNTFIMNESKKLTVLIKKNGGSITEILRSDIIIGVWIATLSLMCVSF
jgi:hypothetical protein